MFASAMLYHYQLITIKHCLQFGGGVIVSKFHHSMHDLEKCYCIKCAIGRLPINCPIWSFHLHVCVLFVIFIIKIFQKEEDVFIDSWSFFTDLQRSLETAETAKSSVVEEKSKLVSFASWVFNFVTNYYSFTECANLHWIIWF